MTDVFISYSRKDIAFARLIWESLKQSQIEPWIDWERIGIGQKWWTEICEAIENANTFMFIISKNSIGSTYCKDEINHALKNNKRIIPVLVDEVTPRAIKKFAPDLPEINWVIFEKEKNFRIEKKEGVESENPEDNLVAKALPPRFEEALTKLNKAIHTDWEWVKYHTQLQVEALRWENNGHKPGYLLHGAALEEAEQELSKATWKDPPQTELQSEFVAASRKAETAQHEERLMLEQKSRRRQKIVVWAVTAGLVVAVILGTVAWNQRNKAAVQSNNRATAEANALHQQATAQIAKTREAEQAQIAFSRQLASHAALVKTSQLDLALLLSLEAVDMADTFEARSSLLSDLFYADPHLQAFLNRHIKTVNSVAFSPDGKTLASGSDDKTILLWDMSDPARAHPLGAPLTGFTTGVYSLAFSPDGKMLASGSFGTIILWDVSNPSNPKQLGLPLTAHSSIVSGLAFSPNGKVLVSGSADKTIILWNVSDPAQAKPLGARLTGHATSIRTIAISPDGKTLASGSDDKTILLWDMSDPATAHPLGAPLTGFTTGVYGLAFSPDGKMLASVGDILILWDVSDPAKASVLSTSKYLSYSHIAFSPDGKILAASYLNDILFLDVSDPVNPKMLQQGLRGHIKSVDSISFSPDGNTLASGSEDKTILLWNVSDLKNAVSLGVRLSAHMDVVTSVAFNPDGKLLASGGGDALVILWDLSDWTQNKPVFKTLNGHSEGVSSVAFSPKGNLLASGSKDKTILLWDINDLTNIKRLGEPIPSEAPVRSLAFSPDGNILAVGTDSLVMWDVSDPANAKSLGEPIKLGGTYSLAFSPDGKILATGSGTTIRLWDISDPASPEQLGSPLKGHITFVTSVAFSPDGKTLASTGDSTIILWDLNDPTNVKPRFTPFTTNGLAIFSVAFSPDGKTLASAGFDGEVDLLDVSDLTNANLLLALKTPEDRARRIAFSPDGKTLASGGFDNTIVLREVNEDAWKTRACQIANRNLLQAEWDQYMPSDESYHKTCPDFSTEQYISTSFTPTAIPVLSTPTPTQEPPTPTAIPPMPTAKSDSSTPASEPTTWNVNLLDDFSSNGYGWKPGGETDCGVENRTIQNGQMLWEIVAKKGCVYPALPIADAVSDFDVAVDMQRLPGSIVSYYGVSFRHQDNNNYYVFIVNDTAHEYSVWAFQNAWRKIIDWTAASAIMVGKVNRIGISARGSAFTFFINNQWVGTEQDDGIEKGYVGVVVWVNNPNPGDKFSVSVDNFELHFNNTK